MERISSDGFLARYHALREIANRHPGLLTMNWMISLLFILVEIAPVVSKLMKPDGPYDHIVNRIDEEVQLEQEAASQVNKTFFSKEFVEHQWARKVNEMEYPAVRSILERNRIFSDHIIQEKTRFDGRMATLFARLKKMKDERAAKKEQRSIDAMLNAHYDAETLSFGKFHQTLHETK